MHGYMRSQTVHYWREHNAHALVYVGMLYWKERSSLNRRKSLWIYFCFANSNLQMQHYLQILTVISRAFWVNVNCYKDRIQAGLLIRKFHRKAKGRPYEYLSNKKMSNNKILVKTFQLINNKFTPVILLKGTRGITLVNWLKDKRQIIGLDIGDVFI